MPVIWQSLYNENDVIEVVVDPQAQQPNTPPAAPADTQPAQQPVTPPQSPPAPAVDPNLPQSYTWEASEYIYHQKPAFWYVGLWVATALIAAILAFFQQWLSIVVLVVMALAVMVYSRKQPRTLSYQLDATGITIHGATTPYASFHSYSVMQDTGWYSVDLEPNKRFVPRLTLICENDDIETIDQILGQHLPRVDRAPDWIESLTRYLRF